jgi:phosphate starvation-inducible protein PhoH
LKTLTETIINLETVNPIEFFGVNNGKLDILKKKFPLVKILSRGTQIKLSGAPEQIEGAREKIDLILQYWVAMMNVWWIILWTATPMMYWCLAPMVKP